MKTTVSAWVLLLLASSVPASADAAEQAEAQRARPSLELLEILGEFTMEDGLVVDPMQLEDLNLPEQIDD